MLKKIIIGLVTLCCTTAAWTEEVVDCNDRRQNYLTIAQAQAVLLPGVILTQQEVTLSQEHIDNIEDTADVTIYTDKLAVWQAPDKSWFIVDQVIGKHENIDYAAAIDKDGKIIGLRILSYRESYGGEICNYHWLAQFIGANHTTHMQVVDPEDNSKFNDIDNITGATLSAVHITDGVNKISHIWQQVLRHL